MTAAAILPAVVPALGDPAPGTVLFRAASGASAGEDGSYRLTVTPTLVTIEADAAAGHFYATRTLLQLLPPQAAAGKRTPR